MAERLTKRDWAIINEALAYYEATDIAGEFSMDDDEAAEVEQAIANARRKVWQRTETAQ